MPQYTFTTPQVDALVNALLSHNERALTMPAAKTVPATAISHYEPAGKAGQLINDLSCFSCHTINGRGGDMAPDLTSEGSSVQRDWLAQFFRNPNTLRPALIRRMPKFNLTDAEINTLTDYIMTVYQSPNIDRDSMPLSGYTPGQVELGKQLYYSKYSCQACHTIHTKQDKGYIGPTLTHVGSRLTAAWIYNWLKDPQALRPGVQEPKRNLSDDEARALTAFLMSQKGRATRGRRGDEAHACILISLLFAVDYRLLASRKADVLLAKPMAYGSAIVESSGGKQAAEVGTLLSQPLVVQVNDEQGNGVPGTLVILRGPNGVAFDPAAGITDSGGQFTTNVSLGTIPGRYQLIASTQTKAGKKVELKVEEIALGYQEIFGSQLNDQYCACCHNQESSPERVSNYDNLEVKPHPFTEGDTLNKMSEADLAAIISHGGPALNKSSLMPPYGYTLSKSESKP